MEPGKAAADILAIVRTALRQDRARHERAIRDRLGLWRWWLVRPTWRVAWRAIEGPAAAIVVRLTLGVVARRWGPLLVGPLEVIVHYEDFVRRRYLPALDAGFLRGLVALFRQPPGAFDASLMRCDVVTMGLRINPVPPPVVIAPDGEAVGIHSPPAMRADEEKLPGATLEPLYYL